MEGSLYHHGIRGQKWGVRNGPPYPLSADDHSARERKAGWRESLSKKSGHTIRRSKQSPSSITTSSKEATSEKPRKERRHMSARTKKILATTATVAALGVIAGVAITNPKVRELAASGKKAAQSALAKGMSTKSTGGQHWDPDFEREHQKYMKAMAADERRAARAQRQTYKKQRRIQKQERDQLFKEVERIRRETKRKEQAEAVRKWANKQKLEAEVAKMMLEDEWKKRRYGNMSSAELLSKARHSRYTHA